jgi:hypothetical protein
MVSLWLGKRFLLTSCAKGSRLDAGRVPFTCLAWPVPSLPPEALPGAPLPGGHSMPAYP